MTDQQQQHQQQQPQQEQQAVVLKVSLIGDQDIGKTCLMIKYVDGEFTPGYVPTLGVNFMDKTIHLRQHPITFTVWDLGGQREFVSMLPLVCSDAIAMLFMFDLSNPSSLNSIREWYRQARGFNRTAIPLLVGTKYDEYTRLTVEDQDEISRQAKKYAKAMNASLVFCSSASSINIQAIFKIIVAKAFNLDCRLKEITEDGEPLLMYKDAN
ncbi:small monomeric GTPase [Ramicandelaber brevisporus]|nr:small monomeric GTPase [Ramicandelaber brevisporus]